MERDFVLPTASGEREGVLKNLVQTGEILSFFSNKKNSTSTQPGESWEGVTEIPLSSLLQSF
jgi:hypothetical protein